MLFANDASSNLETSCCPPKRPEPLLQTLVQANQKLLAPWPLQTTVPEVLQLLGQAIAADQMDIYRHQHHPETGELRMMLGFRGLDNDTQSRQPISSWQNLSYSSAGLQRWLKILQARESIWGSVEALPIAEQTLLRQQQIHSFLLVPVFVEAQLWGVVRCVAGSERPWAETEQAVVQVIADSLGSAITHQSRREMPPVAEASAVTEPAALPLQKKYDLLDSVVNSANALIFVKDRAGKYLLVNQAMANAFNCEARELLGQDDRQLYSDAIAEGIRARDRQLLKEKVPKTFEQRLPVKGELRTFLTSKTPYYDADNNLMGLIGISRDVTEIQQMREERDRFFQLSNDMICTIGFDGFLKRINPAFTRLLGYSNEVLLAQPIADFIHPHDQEKSQKRFARAVAGESLITFTNRWRCHDGDYRWFSWSVIPYADSQICYATARDVTARHQAKVALQESERRFRDVTEAAGEYVWEVDTEGIYTFLTERVQDVKGHSAEFLLGRSSFSVMPPEDMAALKHVLQESSANQKSFQLQHRNITSAGKVVWEEVSGLPIVGHGGEIVGFRGTGLSITEKKEA
ncbi:MAG: PAS domain S-box protein, partial [Cyanobacteria bacterium P01_H01_bin.58]